MSAQSCRHRCRHPGGTDDEAREDERPPGILDQNGCHTLVQSNKAGDGRVRPIFLLPHGELAACDVNVGSVAARARQPDDAGSEALATDSHVLDRAQLRARHAYARQRWVIAQIDVARCGAMAL